ncbi:MAG: hypothetical protein EP330_07170 [Deltaproteobacteria bacterium]|nr:MAG: hypothetical protein EP330_07170 [Deltaproteobacteria bacterium]
MFLLLPLLAVGCVWVGPEDEDDFFDRDGDGVPWPEDCDDDDFNVQDCDTGVVYDGARRRVESGWRAPSIDFRGH